MEGKLLDWDYSIAFSHSSKGGDLDECAYAICIFSFTFMVSGCVEPSFNKHIVDLS